jgi:acid phosphatase
MRRRAALLAFGAVALSACGSSASSPPPTGPVKPSKTSHVVVLVMENKERSQVIGKAPYITALAKRYATATQSYGVMHPSLPDYLALVSGSTHGITSDCTGCSAKGPNLATQLEVKGRTWKSYLEDLPRPCFKGAFSGGYAKKHDPFAYWSSTDCRRRVSSKVLDRDLRRGTLPDFALVVPNQCNDMHDCSVAHGDRYLSQLVPRLLKALGPHGYLVLTFDEGTSNRHGGGQIPTVVAGPDVVPGRASTTFVNHYGVLRTIEDTFGLEHLGAAADPHNGSLRGLFR